MRYMVAVAEELHFGRAAQRLHMAQAPLSTSIQRLEREIGHKLFERTTRSVRLTTAGEEFYRRAVGILQVTDETVKVLDRVAQGIVGTLRVGYVSSASYSILPHTAKRFREKAPSVELQLVPASSGDQIEMLREDRLDIGIVRGEPLNGADMDMHLVYEEELLACISYDHFLASEDRVSAGDLSKEPLIFFRASDMSGFTAEFSRVFRQHPFPRIHTHVVHQETALGFVAAGTGFTLLPASVSAFIPSAVRSLRLDAPAPTTVRMVLPNDREAPAVPIFHEALIESAAAHKLRATNLRRSSR